MTYNKKYSARKRSGMCVQCGQRKSRKNKVLCTKCNQRRQAYLKQKRKKMKKNGLCVRCGAKIEKPGVERCNACRARRAVHDHARYKRLVASNICHRCGKKKGQKHHSLCENCWFKNMASRVFGDASKWGKIRDKFKKQGGKCAYSGTKLMPGRNASLDHIVPKSRGGTNRLSNLQWVDRGVNTMKSNMSHEKFLRLVKKIYKHNHMGR